MNESDEKLRQLIAENIAYYRKLNGDTQAGLAEKLSYSDKSVSKWERGDGTPDIFILSHIASLYGITVQDLLREKKVAKTRTRHLLISLLSVGLVWLVMTVLFCGAQIDPGSPAPPQPLPGAGMRSFAHCPGCSPDTPPVPANCGFR